MARMNWIHLAQGRNQWRALVNRIVDLRVPENAGNLLNSYGSCSRTMLYAVSPTFWKMAGRANNLTHIVVIAIYNIGYASQY
jgi:hypothetical protein